MNTASKKLHVLMAFCFPMIFWATSSLAAELSGTPEELRGYLRSETRTVTISDNASEVAYSDLAKITLIVTTKAKTLASAMKQNNDLRGSVAAQLSKSGISSDDIQSSKYSASPQFGWFGKSPSSFEVVNSLVVTVSGDAAFRQVAEISDQSDTVIFGGVEFEHSKKEEYENKVRDKAVDEVLSDQAYFESKLGLKLQPVSFTFSDVRTSELNRYSGIEEVVVTASKLDSFGDVSVAAPSSFDEVEYRVSVTVTFEVEQIN
ncbi:MAG: SIMPL domain-containing protein [Gammaproteobacteria bacterium]|nr:SIMPL domain-containing protein [Gammaproteobacteria bacterium]